MTFKKIIIIFLLILCVFSFSSVRAENINVTSSSSERMKSDIDYLKQLLKNKNINNMYDLVSFLGADSVDDIQYFYIEDAGHTYIEHQYVYFYYGIGDISIDVDNYIYYGIRQNSFTLPYTFGLRWLTDGNNYLSTIRGSSDSTFTAPNCWFLVKTADLFSLDSSQIVANAVENVNNAVANVNNSINNLNNEITEDKSSQDDINLTTHNDEMNNAGESIKTSDLYVKFNVILNKMNNAFTYNSDYVSIIPISFYGKTYNLRSDTISSFFNNNNLGPVVLLWQSILWFSLFYTMFLFLRKLYKAFVGGDPVDEVSATLSSEDNKIVGGF